MIFLSPTFAGSFGPAMKRCGSRLTVLLAAFFVIFAAHAFAQEATIVGTVTDPSGAAVPNATITVTNVETGQVRNLTSSSDGQYVAPDLHIGRYTVRAQGAGFKVGRAERISCSTSMTEHVPTSNCKSAAPPSRSPWKRRPSLYRRTMAKSATSSLASSLAQLATNGRSMYSLISLTPGASSGQGDFQIPTPVGGDANVSFNGMRESHNLYLLDGGESDDRGGAGGSDVMPSMDAIAEFREMTSNYSAEFGLSSSATMTAVIKSGTKRYPCFGMGVPAQRCP